MIENSEKNNELIADLKKKLNEIDELNETVNDYTNKIDQENITSEMKGSFVDLCNKFTESMKKSTNKIERHISNATVELEKCDEIMKNIRKTNERINPLYSTLVGVGTGLTIVSGVRETKKDDKDEKKNKEEREDRNRGVKDGRI